MDWPKDEPKASKWQFIRPQEKRNTGLPYKCGEPGCTKSFVSQLELNFHKYNHYPAYYRCSVCGFESCFEGDVKGHLPAHFPINASVRAYKKLSK